MHLTTRKLLLLPCIPHAYIYMYIGVYNQMLLTHTHTHTASAFSVSQETCCASVRRCRGRRLLRRWLQLTKPLILIICSEVTGELSFSLLASHNPFPGKLFVSVNLFDARTHTALFLILKIDRDCCGGGLCSSCHCLCVFRPQGN